MQTGRTGSGLDTGNARQPVRNFLNTLGQLINSIGLYGAEHKITQQVLTQAYETLSGALESRRAIRFAFQDDQFFVDDTLIENDNSFINLVRRKLQQMEISGFSFIRGMSKDELGKVAKALAGGPGSNKAILDGKFGHIQQESSRYARVKDSDVVINKKSMAPGASRRAADGAFELAMDDGAGAEKTAPGVQQIMAFLKGDVGILSDATAQALQNTATDIDKLGKMIMEAAAVRQRDPLAAQGESLADIVVGCLRRTFDGLNKRPHHLKDPAAIKKTMMVLEQDILQRLQQAAKYDAGARETVSDAIASMVEDLTVEAISQTYAAQRNVVDANTARLAKYMHNHTPEEINELKSRLIANGMTPEGWQELVVRSGVNSMPGRGGDGALNTNAGLAALGTLLAKLDQLMSSSGKLHSPDAQRAIEDVNQGVRCSAENAAGKIHNLEGAIIETSAGMRAPGPSPSRQAAMSNARIMEIIAEIVQELAQSLSAVNCAVTMTLQERIGPLAEAQKSILKLAADSGEHLDELFQRLLKVAGLPKTLQPDKDSVYNIKIG